MPPRHVAGLVCAVVLWVFGPVSAAAQAVSLDRPVATLAEPFSFVRGLRELADGRVLVTDYIENRVALVDFASGNVTDVLTEGAGPASVRLPMGIVPFGDSSAVVDYGNSRLVLLDGRGRALRTQTVEVPGRLFVRGLTPTGEWWYAVPAWAEGPAALADDSVRVVRWRPGANEVTTEFVVQGTRYRKDRSPALEPRLPTVAFAGQDAWAVAGDGSIWVVRHAPYRVERRSADGRWRQGPVLPAEQRQVTAADKRRFIIEFAAANPTSGRGPGGGMGRTPAPTAQEIARLIETTEWSDVHAPFVAAGIFVSPAGELWVLRESDPARPARYDVFNEAGQRLRQVTLGGGRRVVLVGARGVYVTREDGDGVQYLERFALP